MLKYRKDAGAPYGQFYLNNKPVKIEEAVDAFNKLKHELKQVNSMLALETAKFNQLKDRHEALKDKHEKLLGLKANLK